MGGRGFSTTASENVSKSVNGFLDDLYSPARAVKIPGESPRTMLQTRFWKDGEFNLKNLSRFYAKEDMKRRCNTSYVLNASNVVEEQFKRLNLGIPNPYGGNWGWTAELPEARVHGRLDAATVARIVILGPEKISDPSSNYAILSSSQKKPCKEITRSLKAKTIILECSSQVLHKVELFTVPFLGGLLDNSLRKIHADMTCPEKCVAYKH
ncbi:hypothetical protein DFH09DRAFT_1079249 [Mycena vulgaris]|nr:hypothetical protein DFH09DRAFT_1079249 [Mycena vulgaris]